jgi:sn-glycerol 3-phosphate transport system ATP-binding protein
MARVSLTAVKKIYGKTVVIQDLNLDIDDGELIVIVGPSGCGKSTLLRMVAGLETITAGEIRIADRVVNNLEPRQRDIAMVFQNYALYPHMTVYSNMAYSLKIAGLDKKDIEKRIGKTARLLELEPFLQRKPRQLSGGQRQRVAMGRAIVRNPAVFLFDEPLSNLDARLRVQMRMEIKTLQRTLGATLLYVTHDQVEAMTLADRMVVMNDGVVEQVGTPLEVYHNPATTFVAGFIGSPPMNFLDIKNNPAMTPSGRVTPEVLEVSSHGAAQVGVRPEHLQFCAPGAGLCDAEVAFFEELGAETLVHLHSANGEKYILRRESDTSPPALGSRVGLTADQEHRFFFDSAGRRLADL